MGPLALGAGLIAAAYAVGNQRPTFTNKRGGHPKDRPTLPSTIQIDPAWMTSYRNEAATINGGTINGYYHGVHQPSGGYFSTMRRVEQYQDQINAAEAATHPGVRLVLSLA